MALTAADAVGVAIVVSLAALILLAAIRIARKKRAEGPAEAPVSDEEIERELEVDAGAAPPAAAGMGTPSPEPSRPAGDGGLDVAEAEERRKKEEYHRRKEARRELQERRRHERGEEERRARQEGERQAREAQEARRREEEAKRRRIEAEGGKTLAAGLERTRGGFMARLNGLFATPRALDDRVLAELEEVLFTADIGVRTATALLAKARDHLARGELSNAARLRDALREEIGHIVSLGGTLQGDGLRIGEARPWVVMVVGVNGSGKTTTIGKLAAQLQRAGRKVLLAAGDTFRAAAGEQLEIWAERVAAPIVRGKEGSDPASVCFEAVKRGQEQGTDVVLCDTAGRLHTKVPLMEELKKVKRVLDKALPGAPHDVLLVLDATNGQNAIAQARQFHEALAVTGIALTKLDGTAKGGVIIGICEELGIPVRYVGVGEKVPDLRPFVPAEFVDALFA